MMPIEAGAGKRAEKPEKTNINNRKRYGTGANEGQNL